MKKIFFACSMRGGHKKTSTEELRQIVDVMESSGFELVSKHQVDKKTIENERSLSLREIYEGDIGWLKEADFVVAEISNPSLGVGAEVAEAVHLGKPVLCIYKKGIGRSVSAFLRGKPGVQCAEYGSLGEFRAILFDFAEKKK
ncbi:MAG: nucleoside 2-deoxyribosyltransferase [Candidatus Woesearchaeota archaeon]